MKLSNFNFLSLLCTIFPSMAVVYSTEVGAAYFMTNQDQNSIVSNAIQSNGSVSFYKAFSTYGQGSGGMMAMPGADPLFSQDSVKVAGSTLYVVNAGSNTVSTFKIDTSDPTKLTLIGSPVWSGGEFPISIAVSCKLKMVCVLNGGAVNGVSCYRQDKTAGLVPIDGTTRALHLAQTTPPSGPAGTASDIIFNRDSTKLLASVKGIPPVPGFLAAWDIGSDGSLSTNFQASVPATGGLLPFSMTQIKGQDALLVTDPAIGFSIYDLSPLSIPHNTSATSSIIKVDGQKAICWSSFSPRTGNYYLSDAGSSTIVETSVSSQLQGFIVKQYTLAANSSTIDNAIASLPTNDFLYVLSAGMTSIDVMELNGPGGASHVQSFNLSAPLKAAGVLASTQRLQGMGVYVKDW